jgi:hypothetical protein
MGHSLICRNEGQLGSWEWDGGITRWCFEFVLYSIIYIQILLSMNVVFGFGKK